MGKTSFLELLKTPTIWQQYGLDATQAVIVMFNCQSIEHLPFTFSDFWRKILAKIKDNFANLSTDINIYLEQEKITKNDLSNILSNILRKLGGQNKFLLLLIDNYDVALRPNPQHTDADIEALVSAFRTIANAEKEREYISMIVTSSRRLSEIGPQITHNSSPWFNQYLFQHLKPFTDAEVDSLLAKSESLSNHKEAIRKIADGHPALLQNACYLLYEELHSGNTPNTKTFIGDFQSATLDIFKTIWHLSTENEQTLLMLLALVILKGNLGKNSYDLGGIEKVFSQKEIELNSLVERGILKEVEQEDNKTYTFCSSIMEWWVIKQVENSDEEELNKRQKTFGKLMSRQQSQKVNTAFRWIWQNKDKIIPIFYQIKDLYLS